MPLPNLLMIFSVYNGFCAIGCKSNASIFFYKSPNFLPFKDYVKTVYGDAFAGAVGLLALAVIPSIWIIWKVFRGTRSIALDIMSNHEAALAPRP